MTKLLFILGCLFVFAQQAHGQGILQNPIQGPITASSTNCTTQGDQSCLWMKLPANAAVVSVTVSGTFSETLVAEYTGDSGAHWTTAATLTTAGLTSYVVAGMTDFRVRASAVVSGTALITIQASLAPSGGVTSGTTDPTGNACAANSVYVRSTNGFFYTCDAGVFALSGGSTVSITATSPIVVTPSPITGTGVISIPSIAPGCQSGCSYALGLGDAPSGIGGTGGALSVANQPAMYRFYNDKARNITTACFVVTTTSAGGLADVAVYSVSGTAMSLIWHTGAKSTTGTGQQCATATTANLLAGQNYYIAFCADNATATVSQLTGGNANIAVMLGTAGGTAHTYGLNATDVSTGGVCPGTATTTNITNNVAKALASWLQVFN